MTPDLAQWHRLVVGPEIVLVRLEPNAMVRIRALDGASIACAMRAFRREIVRSGYVIRKERCCGPSHEYAWSGFAPDGKRSLSLDRRKWDGVPVRGRIVVRDVGGKPLAFFAVWDAPSEKRSGKRAPRPLVDPLSDDVSRIIVETRPLQ